ncbi:glycoside hydrolase family 73 protein [Enterococcus rivorum]|uniref:N-acetylmuramoyl-L-alanine amidase n=1 Tax=Enterococcus rivorum TaxID=762845 RepID=A0A1E5KSX0_9ENTE|nr:glycoside hydrolase family 73 protein [Enterococcus rivorum]MBP2098009.1 flagellum-specific peptidoglycan hydrolase FlgJ [Enterococcus rivorum]OEH80960.1 N-acetylmuramoyl-L-alanine amidase [Enterococcus rivorum]
MSVRKYKKRKNNKPSLPALFAGLLLVGVLFVFSLSVLSDSNEPQLINEEQQKKVSKEEFIGKISPYAQELQASYGVLPSIIIGQAILESNWGQSTLAAQYNNLFGIKAYGDQKKINLETKEYVNEVWITIQGDFRVYNTWEESMDDHTKLFINGVTWNPRLYDKVLLATNYKEAARALQEAGYATDPTYAEKVIGVIESYKLYTYD